MAEDLHALIEHAHLPTPVVLVGSSGANYVRIFAERHPEQVAGVVLLDGQPAEAFERLPGYRDHDIVREAQRVARRRAL